MQQEQQDWNCKFLYPGYLSNYSPKCCQTPTSSRNNNTIRKRRLLNSSSYMLEPSYVAFSPEINQNFNYSSEDDFSCLEIPQNNWEFLSSPEWRKELNQTPIEPCFSETNEPTSWVNMTAVEPSEEFWTQELDFDGYQHAIDYIKGICENKKQITYPSKILNLIEVHNIPPHECRTLVNRLQEIYLNKGLHRWADELENFTDNDCYNSKYSVTGARKIFPGFRLFGIVSPSFTPHNCQTFTWDPSKQAWLTYLTKQGFFDGK